MNNPKAEWELILKWTACFHSAVTEKTLGPCLQQENNKVGTFYFRQLFTWRKCHAPFKASVRIASMMKFVLPVRQQRSNRNYQKFKRQFPCWGELILKNNISSFPWKVVHKQLPKLPAKSVTLSNRRSAVMMKNTSWYPTYHHHHKNWNKKLKKKSQEHQSRLLEPPTTSMSAAPARERKRKRRGICSQWRWPWAPGSGSPARFPSRPPPFILLLSPVSAPAAGAGAKLPIGLVLLSTGRGVLINGLDWIRSTAASTCRSGAAGRGPSKRPAAEVRPARLDHACGAGREPILWPGGEGSGWRILWTSAPARQPQLAARPCVRAPIKISPILSGGNLAAFWLVG